MKNRIVRSLAAIGTFVVLSGAYAFAMGIDINVPARAIDIIALLALAAISLICTNSLEE